MDSVNLHCFEEPSACLFLNHGQNSTCLEMVVYISELMEERENPMEWEQMPHPHFLFLLKKKLLEWQVTSPCLQAPCAFAEGTSACVPNLPLFLWLGLIGGVQDRQWEVKRGPYISRTDTERVQKLFPVEPLLLEAELLGQVLLDVCACVHACIFKKKRTKEQCS